MDKFLLRGAIILVLLYVGYEIKKQNDYMKEDAAAEAQGNVPDENGVVTEYKPKGNGVILLTLYIFLAAGLGFITMKWIIPAFSDRVSQAFLGSNEVIELDENSKVMVLVTQGRYQEAIDEFAKLAEKHPTDRFPVIEMAKLQKEKLHDPAAAIAVYQEALTREWPADDAGLFHYKTAEIYEEANDMVTAKQILNEIIQSYPGSVHAGHANHKLREIEEAEFLATRGGQ